LAWLPKGTDLSVHTADNIAGVRAELNARPRKGERLDELLYVRMTRATTELVVITPPRLAKRFR
jgi:ATP-dependent exoDNAse (exonuclease V) beta subunit